MNKDRGFHGVWRKLQGTRVARAQTRQHKQYLNLGKVEGSRNVNTAATLIPYNTFVYTC